MPFHVGAVVADYEILEVLGQGGMGAVYRVRNVLSDRHEAMKHVLPHIASSPEAADRFLREIKIQASLQHPNIAALHTAMRVEEGIVMIMELVDGQSLAALLRAGPLPVAPAVRIADEILGALAYAHEQGVVHRDIKPANVLITSRGVPKLTDFGISRAAGKESITRSGMAIGSLHYMSPEQVMSKNADERSDLYSLGVTLYEMLTGKRPIDGDSEYAIMNAHVFESPAPPDRLVPSISPELSAVVLKSMAKAPEQRYQTAADFQAALWEAVLGGEGGQDAPTALDPAEVARIEAPLKEILGPIAKSLIAKESQRRSTFPEFCERLADRIPSQTDRARFLKIAGSTSGSRAAPAPAIDAAGMEAARKALAVYLGPIAGVIAAKAAKNSRSAEEFRAALAQAIPNERDRDAFLGSF
jgi:serine/threonine-protein kinase